MSFVSYVNSFFGEVRPVVRISVLFYKGVDILCAEHCLDVMLEIGTSG